MVSPQAVPATVSAGTLISRYRVAAAPLEILSLMWLIPAQQPRLAACRTVLAVATLPAFSIRTTGTSSYYTISGFVLRNPVACYEGNQGTGIRIINNDCQDVDASSKYASFKWIGTNYIVRIRQYLHDSGGNAKLNSGFYFTSDANHGWFGWNTVGSGIATSSMMVEVHSTGGNDQYDWHLHDNAIQNARCNGMVLASVDPSKGIVEVYNNTFAHNGTGPNPSDSSCWQYSNLYFSGTLDAGPAPSGTVDTYNNTFYDCGPFLTGGFATYGCVEILNQGAGPSLFYRFTNNIFYPTLVEGKYFSSDAPNLADHWLFQ